MPFFQPTNLSNPYLHSTRSELHLRNNHTRTHDNPHAPCSSTRSPLHHSLAPLPPPPPPPLPLPLPPPRGTPPPLINNNNNSSSSSTSTRRASPKRASLSVKKNIASVTRSNQTWRPSFVPRRVLLDLTSMIRHLQKDKERQTATTTTERQQVEQLLQTF